MTNLQQQIAELDSEGLRPAEIAKRVGKSRQYVWTTLSRVKAGYRMRPVTFGAREISGPHCDRCNLRGEHVCLPPSWWYGTARCEP